MKGQGFSRRLGFALQGLKRAFVSERSFRTHLGAAAGVLLVLILTRPAPIWWAVLGLAVQRGALSGAAALDLSRLDEAFTEERWGVDEEAAARVAAHRDEASLLQRWFEALRG